MAKAQAHQLYDNLRDGILLSDTELKIVHKHFKDMADLLRVSGPIFALAAKEAWYITDTCADIIAARKAG